MNWNELFGNSGNVALVMDQTLQPMEGWHMPVFPPTYPANKDRSQAHRFDTPYTINETRDPGSGELIRVAALDSVESQANRIEAAFVEQERWAALIPQVSVTAGDKTLTVSELPHRLADASIRASDMTETIREAFEAYEGGDPAPIARLNPLALLLGAWDSRDTRVKIPRALRSEINAWDVDVFTRSAQFSGAFRQDELGMTDKQWKQGAEKGFAPSPAVDQHGGIIVHREIRQTATLHLGALQQLDRASDGLGQYLFGLGLASLAAARTNYNLRSGCWLVPAGTGSLVRVENNGTREEFVSLDAEVEADMWTFVEKEALAAAKNLGIEPGTVVHEATFDRDAASEILKSKEAE